MIYLSAQPDDYYFLWQLELQLFNFRKIGITSSQIHVLVGFNPNFGLSEPFQRFINAHEGEAQFYVYEDTRKSKEYASSIRPHLIAKHYASHPYLTNETVFYHDSDILLKEPVKLELPIEEKIWLSSDTSSYTGINDVLAHTTPSLFARICETIETDTSFVKENDVEAGGAQYILNGVDAKFWQKIERDCENVYILLRNDCQNGNTGDRKKDNLDFWLTDIWVLRWNALMIGYKIKVHRNLDFCWISTPLEEWGYKNILHYTGINDVFSDKNFVKSKYKIHPPYRESFSMISNGTCSKVVVNLINEFNEYRWEYKYTHSVIVVESTSYSAEALATLKAYYAESGLKVIEMPDYVNFISCNVACIYICIPPETLVPVECLSDLLTSTENGRIKSVSVVGDCYKIDLLTKCIFEKTLDAGYLLHNKGKFKKTEESMTELSSTNLFPESIETYNIGDKIFIL